MERIHIYKQGNPFRPLILLLHGTGGDEKSLLDMAARIDKDAGILSLRGEVNEDGLNRHFKRLSLGVFDEVDLHKRTSDLEQFLDFAANKYGFPRHQIVGLGYSNGANLLASHLFKYPKSVQGAILLHPLSAGTIDKIPDLFGLPIFIGVGEEDPICPQEMTQKLFLQLHKTGANVTLSWHQFGHNLSTEEIQKASTWYQSFFK